LDFLSQTNKWFSNSNIINVNSLSKISAIPISFYSETTKWFSNTSIIDVYALAKVWYRQNIAYARLKIKSSAKLTLVQSINPNVQLSLNSLAYSYQKALLKISAKLKLETSATGKIGVSANSLNNKLKINSYSISNNMINVTSQNTLSILQFSKAINKSNINMNFSFKLSQNSKASIFENGIIESAIKIKTNCKFNSLMLLKSNPSILTFNNFSTSNLRMSGISSGSLKINAIAIAKVWEIIIISTLYPDEISAWYDKDLEYIFYGREIASQT